MRTAIHRFRLLTVSLACLGWLLPTAPSLAADPATPSTSPAKPTVYDLKLDSHGALRGQLLDAAGQRLAERLIVLSSEGDTVCRGKTDKGGRFAFHNLKGGVYQIGITDAVVVCRIWTANAAPPAAKEQLLIVATDGPVVRGQQPIGAVFSNPLVVGVVIATAIAVPIAVHDSSSEKPPGS